MIYIHQIPNKQKSTCSNKINNQNPTLYIFIEMKKIIKFNHNNKDFLKFIQIILRFNL